MKRLRERPLAIGRSGLALAVMACLAPPSFAQITVSDGPVNPAYTGDDPWTINGPLELDESTLSITGGSRVSATELFADGRVLISAGGVLTVDATTLLDAPNGNSSAGAFHLDGGTMNAGAFTLLDSNVLYLGIDAGRFTTDAAGGIGAGSTVVISLDDGGVYEGVGDTRFGADTSSVSIGPTPADPTGFTGTIASITSLVTQEKAKVTDAAMANISGLIASVTGAAMANIGSATASSPIVGLGNDTVFRIDGDLALGGATTDVLMHFNDGSSFEVTGELVGPATTSDSSVAVIDSSFTVGEAARLLNGGGSSIFLFFVRAPIDVGGDLAVSVPTNASSTVNLTVGESPVSIGGGLLIQGGDNSATTLSLRDSPDVSIGADFLVGSGMANDSASSLFVENTTIEVGGHLRHELGANSVVSTEFDAAQVTTVGDLFWAIGADSTNTFQAVRTDFSAGGSLVLQRAGTMSSTSITMEQIGLDVTSDFRLETTGADADSLFFLRDVGGTIGRDFRVLTGLAQGSISDRVFIDLTLDIGRDFAYEVTETSNPGQQTLFFGSSTLTIARNAIIGSDVIAPMLDSTFNVGGQFTINGELRADEVTVNGNAAVCSRLRVDTPNVIEAGMGITANGDLLFAPASSLTLIMDNGAPNPSFIPVNHDGDNPITLGGNLFVEFSTGVSNGFTAGDSIPLVVSNRPINGAFANVAVGGQVPVINGSGSFTLTTNPAGDTLFLTSGPAALSSAGAEHIFADGFEPALPPECQVQ